MIKGKILNSKEVRSIKEQLIKQYGAAPEKDYAWIESNRDRIYIINREIANIPYDNLYLDHVGLYFCTRHPDSLRLSLDGSQLLGPKATKNVIEISPDLLERWMRGEDLPLKVEEKGYVIIKSGKDY